MSRGHLAGLTIVASTTSPRPQRQRSRPVVVMSTRWNGLCVGSSIISATPGSCSIAPAGTVRAGVVGLRARLENALDLLVPA
jgi:hypothetical protein